MCQIFCLDGDRRGNFVRIDNAIRDAKDAGADIDPVNHRDCGGHTDAGP